MPIVKRLLIQNACYHLMTRGNQKQEVFKCEQDYYVYLSLLSKFKRKYNFRLYGYCLMPNHVHLLGEIKNKDMLSKFMHGLNRNYTAYFNMKYGKVGHLWQGRFKSKVITKNEYLIECLNYIEQNAVRSGLVKTISEYPWNSYTSRILRADNKLVDEWTLD